MFISSGYGAPISAKLVLSCTIHHFVSDGAVDTKLTYMTAKSADSVH